MRYIITEILLVIATLSIEGRDLSLADILRLNYMNSNYWEWLTSDSLLYNPIIQEFAVNQEEDTIFITCYENIQDQIGVTLWNRSQGVNAYKNCFTDSTFYVRKTNINQLDSDEKILINWDIDTIKRFYEKRVPPIQCFIHRIVIHNKKLKIDTIGFYELSYSKDLWIKERETKYSQTYNNRKSMDSITEPQRTETPHPKEPSRSILQRIIDWFRNLWKSIFG